MRRRKRRKKRKESSEGSIQFALHKHSDNRERDRFLFHPPIRWNQFPFMYNPPMSETLEKVLKLIEVFFLHASKVYVKAKKKGLISILIRKYR